jgi:pimeloyl-ACP methyl ester carboxylesterase
MTRECTFDTGKVKLNYLDYGNPTAEPIVMLHGGAWCWQEYLSLIPDLAQHWHVYALDLRGNGRSGWVPNGYSLQDFTADNAGFLQQLNAPAVLVGHSIGGIVALMLAARYPDKVKGLIIEDPTLFRENYKRIIDEGSERFDLWLNLKKQAHSELDLAVLLAEAYKDISVSSTWTLFFAGCLWRLDPTFFDVLLYDFDRFIEGYEYQTIFRSLRCPVLILRGETALGAVLTDEEIAWLKSNCSNVRCALFNGLGHLLHLQDAGCAPVLKEFMAFLDRVQTPVASTHAA